MIVASDGRPGHPAQVGDHIGLSLRGSDKVAMAKAFKVLAEGGTVAMPLREMPWGTSGWLADHFGINWNFDISQGCDRRPVRAFGDSEQVCVAIELY